jgi:hypothetical protein
MTSQALPLPQGRDNFGRANPKLVQRNLKNAFMTLFIDMRQDKGKFYNYFTSLFSHLIN